MKHNFDEFVARRHSGCYKWDIDSEEDIIPMWVADMDFKVAEPIVNALRKRVEHGVFGYTKVGDSYYDAITSWFSRRHGWTIDRQWVIYTTGVVPAISAALKAMTLPGEKVLLLTPVYNCFYSSIQNSGCATTESELVRTGDTFAVDFNDFECRCADPKTTVFLLCNPHNPAGRVWTKEELKKMNDICMRHDVRVIADEIHCELVMPGHKYTPFASIDDDCLGNSVTLNSPSKSFNIAGLQTANIVCKDLVLLRRIDRAVNINEICDLNPFGPIALEAAYNECEYWIDQLNEYIWGNYTTMKDYFAKELPAVNVIKLEGTYLAWIDITATGLSSERATAKLLKEGKVRVSSGTLYGRSAGEGYLRINMACPRSLLMQGVERIAATLKH